MQRINNSLHSLYIMYLQVNDVVAVNVASTQQTGPYTYMVTSGGRIVHHGTGQLSSGTSTFSLTVTQSYTPQAYIVVSAVVGGELLADSISFNIDGVFQNSVSIALIYISTHFSVTYFALLTLLCKL